MSSSFSEDQLQPADTLDDRGTDDVLDEGLSPPERPSRPTARAETASEEAAGETLEERLEQEEPDPTAEIDHTAQAQLDEIADPDAPRDPSDGLEIGDERSGRLVEPETGATDESNQLPAADDAGIDGGAAGAEEAAVHVVDDDLI